MGGWGGGVSAFAQVRPKLSCFALGWASRIQDSLLRVIALAAREMQNANGFGGAS